MTNPIAAAAIAPELLDLMRKRQAADIVQEPAHVAALLAATEALQGECDANERAFLDAARERDACRADAAGLQAAAEAQQARIAELEGQWAKLERLLRAGWGIIPDYAPWPWCVQRGRLVGKGPTLAAAVQAAPEPEAKS